MNNTCISPVDIMTDYIIYSYVFCRKTQKAWTFRNQPWDCWWHWQRMASL